MKPVIYKHSLAPPSGQCRNRLPLRNRQSAFTLVETIVGIVVAAIALTFLTTVFFSNAERSVEPMLQIKAAEFGQSLMDEILSKPFDENTPLGGVPACDATTCTAIANLGSDTAEARSDFDDVDDYHDYCNNSPLLQLVDVFGNLPDSFANYRMSICVAYDGDYDGMLNEVGASEFNAKLIQVDIYPPGVGGLDTALSFIAYRGNF